MPEFDPSTPSIARVYDYLLDGKDIFAVDRAVAERLLAVAPLTAEVTRENRQFLARAVTWAANRGIGQFIDTYSTGPARVYKPLGAGLRSFFGPLELVPSGVVDAREWRPGWE